MVALTTLLISLRVTWLKTTLMSSCWSWEPIEVKEVLLSAEFPGLPVDIYSWWGFMREKWQQCNIVDDHEWSVWLTSQVDGDAATDIRDLERVFNRLQAAECKQPQEPGCFPVGMAVGSRYEEWKRMSCQQDACIFLIDEWCMLSLRDFSQSPHGRRLSSQPVLAAHCAHEGISSFGHDSNFRLLPHSLASALCSPLTPLLAQETLRTHNADSNCSREGLLAFFSSFCIWRSGLSTLSSYSWPRKWACRLWRWGIDLLSPHPSIPTYCPSVCVLICCVWVVYCGGVISCVSGVFRQITGILLCSILLLGTCKLARSGWLQIDSV